MDNARSACSTRPIPAGTRPPVSPVPACSTTHRNTPLTCANVPTATLFRSTLVPHTRFHATPNHVSAGQSVIHNERYSPVTACSTTPGTPLTCTNALVPLDPKREFPCPTTVPAPAPTGRARTRERTHAHTPARGTATQPAADPGATR